MNVARMFGKQSCYKSNPRLEYVLNGDYFLCKMILGPLLVPQRHAGTEYRLAVDAVEPEYRLL